MLKHPGALAQLGERYAGSVEVSGSIPLCSIIINIINGFRFFLRQFCVVVLDII
ncbi:hypothetical protein BACI9J_60092 [Bacillus altitudinis]|nr:hypothetical protein BACI9J_60092 [Bacillus altitudinis]